VSVPAVQFTGIGILTLGDLKVNERLPEHLPKEDTCHMRRRIHVI
jgi:hypothetical protein